MGLDPECTEVQRMPKVSFDAPLVVSFPLENQGHKNVTRQEGVWLIVVAGNDKVARIQGNAFAH